MRGNGINYDTGFIHRGVSSRTTFERSVVTREIQTIREDLHCTAVRITGGDPERLELAAGIAAAAGLEVWFAPFTCNLTEEEMLALLVDCAMRAERLRRSGATVVLVIGAELSLLNNGFLPGDTLDDRMELLTDRARLRAAMPEVPARINAFLGTALAAVREHFGGQVTYAAMPFEQVDWTPFDFVGLDLYRSAEVADQFAAAIRALVSLGKPVAITEFGAATFRGAADMGARAGEVIVWDKETIAPLGLNGNFVRDEQEQATYVRELLEIFAEAGVDSTFVFTFALYQLPYRADPDDDLDRASYGIVKVYEDRFGDSYPDMRWEPKAAFTAVADFYGSDGGAP